HRLRQEDRRGAGADARDGPGGGPGSGRPARRHGSHRPRLKHALAPPIRAQSGRSRGSVFAGRGQRAATDVADQRACSTQIAATVAVANAMSGAALGGVGGASSRVAYQASNETDAATTSRAPARVALAGAARTASRSTNAAKGTATTRSTK